MPLHMSSGTEARAFRSIHCEVSGQYMVNQMKTLPTELPQMIRGKMSARLPRTIVAEFSLETPLEDLGLDSLDRVCLLFEIEELFNVAISDVTALPDEVRCGHSSLCFEQPTGVIPRFASAVQMDASDSCKGVEGKLLGRKFASS